MARSRPHIPHSVARAVKLEAGFQCAVPGCGWPLTERCHIIDRSESPDDCFANLIAFCDNHHGMHTRGMIDSATVRVVKAQLAIKNERYSYREMMWLDLFNEAPNREGWYFREEVAKLGCIRQLEEDGYIDEVAGSERVDTDGGLRRTFHFTKYGRLFVKAWGEADAHRLSAVINARFTGRS